LLQDLTMPEYLLCHLKDPDYPDLRRLTALREHDLPSTLANANAGLYGIFGALFGLATNECYLLVTRMQAYADNNANDPVAASIKVCLAKHGFTLLESYRLAPTVRPIDHSQRFTEGLYVFRWFKVSPSDVAEIAELSANAWVTFERDFATEIQGLFAGVSNKASGQNDGNMLLLTRYEDFSVWEDSRKSAPEARDNFRRRHALTRSALPVATRLI
tara:strand:+ start:253 stop:900 length:648 start_codon:yes stop_codon:yes gene_type:complete